MFLAPEGKSSCKYKVWYNLPREMSVYPEVHKQNLGIREGSLISLHRKKVGFIFLAPVLWIAASKQRVYSRAPELMTELCLTRWEVLFSKWTHFLLIFLFHEDCFTLKMKDSGSELDSRPLKHHSVTDIWKSWSAHAACLVMFLWHATAGCTVPCTFNALI